MPPNAVAAGQRFITHTEGFGSGDISVDVIDPFAIKDNNEYQVIFDKLEDSDLTAFSVRNQEIILETLVIQADSSASASYDNIDARMILTPALVNDSTVYDTTFPLVVTNVSGCMTYEYGVDYTIIAAVGRFFISAPELILSGQCAVSYRYFHLYNLGTINGETDNPLFDGMRIIVSDTDYDLNED